MTKTAIVTGGSGFLGQYVCKLLEDDYRVIVPRSKDYDFTSQFQTISFFNRNNYAGIDLMVNLAANVGGIGYNANHPYNLYYDNLMICTNLVNEAIKHNVRKFVQVGTVCSYPKFAKPPFRVSMIWDGYPEETNAPYGLAKKMALVQLQTAWQEFNFQSCYLFISNLYGPGDSFADYRSHVIPALIKRFTEAKNNSLAEVEVWGTGNATRDFLYVEDAAKAIVSAAEKLDHPRMPLNIGSGIQTRISWLVGQIRELIGYEGKIKWDLTKSDGQPARGLNIDNALYVLDWQPEVKLRDGLKMTVEWYKNNASS